MKILILTVGSKTKGELSTLINEFLKRLPKHIHLEWKTVSCGVGSPIDSKKQEAENMLRVIPKNYFVILLDESGTQITSRELSEILFNRGNNMLFIIGGPYGVDESIKKQSDAVISLSRLTFPHQIVKILLVEQIYRAYTIHSDHPYHHD